MHGLISPDINLNLHTGRPRACVKEQAPSEMPCSWNTSFWITAGAAVTQPSRKPGATVCALC